MNVVFPSDTIEKHHYGFNLLSQTYIPSSEQKATEDIQIQDLRIEIELIL